MLGISESAGAKDAERIMSRKLEKRLHLTFDRSASVLGMMMWFVRQGIRVLPIHGIVEGRCTCGHKACESPGKHPISALGPNGVKGATATLKTLKKWHRQYPDMNYAVATEGLAVIDCDSKEALAAFRSRYRPPPTFTVRTARGFHFYFRDEMPSRNAAQDKLDVKSGPGCYVVGPCSTQVSGDIYTLWEDRRFAELPGNIASLTQRRGEASETGDGKSQFCAWLCARVSRGQKLPNGEKIEPANCFLFNFEDLKGAVIKPRLKANGADLSRVFIQSLSFDLSKEMTDWLDGEIADKKARPVILDPIQAFMSGVDGNSNIQVREFMSRLGEIADKRRCAIICVRHFGKGPQEHAMKKGLGSTDFVGISRNQFGLARRNDDVRGFIVFHLKTNFEKGDAMLFTMGDADGREGEQPKIGFDKSRSTPMISFRRMGVRAGLSRTRGRLLRTIYSKSLPMAGRRLGYSSGTPRPAQSARRLWTGGERNSASCLSGKARSGTGRYRPNDQLFTFSCFHTGGLSVIDRRS